MTRLPTYLRVVATTACPLACAYCHAEGDWQRVGAARGLPADLLARCLAVAADAGIRKFKFIGGEPLVRRELPAIVRSLRDRRPNADLSVITSGTPGLARAHDLFDAGLDRMNLSIHGWTPAALARRGGNDAAHARRHELLTWLIEFGRPLKLNYVVGTDDEDDVRAFLAWAAGKPVVVNLLDDLHDPRVSAATLLAQVHHWRGPSAASWQEADPDSLPITRLRWRDGLVVELKTSRLGEAAPWTSCATCAVRAGCREGIFALRLTHDGRLQPCMDRPDLSLPLAELVAEDPAQALARWRVFVADPGTATTVRRPRLLPVVREACR
jgi:cyclic pyranopterin phosphate synthase